MLIGGSGPNHSRLNLDQIHGTGQEAHIDYNEAAVMDEDAAYFRRAATEHSAVVHPHSRVEPLHGQESAGLGTSTFLEGAPASRAAIQRRESENEAAQLNGASISRKKSLVQKFRSVRSGGGAGGGRVTSPEPFSGSASPLGTAKSESNVNPFFKDYDKEVDRRAGQIALVQEERRTGRARAPSSPHRAVGLERKTTTENMGTEEGKGGTGLLNRVKSLKGRSKPRSERREISG